MVRRTAVVVATLAWLAGTLAGTVACGAPADPSPVPTTQPPRTLLGVVTPGSPLPVRTVPPGTGPTDPETGYAVPDDLRRRPLNAPALPAGRACPVDLPHPSGVAEAGDVSGPGPVYMGSLSAAGELGIAAPGDPNSGFTGPYGGQKVGWLIDPSRYTGPVLIRGVRLDRADPDAVRFWDGSDPPDAMQLPPGPSGSAIPGLDWTFWPSLTRLREPGCYAWQVDGLDFSYLVTFRAVPRS